MLSTQIKFLRRPRRTLLLAVLTQEGDKVLIIVNPFSISKTPAIRQSIYIYFSFQFQTLRQKKKSQTVVYMQCWTSLSKHTLNADA